MEMLTVYSDGIKSDKLGHVSGYLVRFGSPDAVDLEGDYFTQNTDFGFPVKSGSAVPLNLYYHHGMDTAVGKRCIGTGYVKMTDAGLWYEAQVDLADEYGKMIAKLCKQGVMGYSSGAAGHLVQRKSTAGVNEIVTWPIAEASITPTPAEYRNTVKSLKDFYMDAEMDPSEEMDNMAEMLDETEPLVGEDPSAYIEKVYAGTGDSIIHETIEGLYENLCMGLMGLRDVPGDRTAYVTAIIDGFADRAKQLVLAIGADPLLAKSVHPASLRNVERRLRDAVGLSRSGAKRLAPVVWENLRDADQPEVAPDIVDPEVKTLNDEERADIIARLEVLSL
jgi:hypothetical protein